MTQAVVIHLDEDNDLYTESFDSIDEVHIFLETLEWKAILVTGDNLLTIDRT